MTHQSDIGFAGLRTLVSDVESLLREAERSETQTDTLSRPDASPADATSSRSTATPPPEQPRRAPKRSLRVGRIGLVALVVAIVAAVNMNSDSSSSRRGMSYGAPAASAYSAASNSPAVENDPYGVMLSSTPETLDERQPAAGDAYRVLDVSEIEYCLAEDIRIASARTSVNSYDHAAVTLFNTHIDDYNVRCGNYQYRESDMSRARTVVEQHRATLEAEGRAWF
jgi:hypothetical protein